MHRGYVPAAAPAPYFFLSYAHTPRLDAGDQQDPDFWVGQLYEDLCRHIMQLTAFPRGANPGFMDRKLRSGDNWPTELVQALATCHVFVPLYSRRYFASEHCGKEWLYFTRRALNHSARVADPVDAAIPAVDAIIPAVWVPLEPWLLPPAAQSIQVTYGASEPYQDLGFYGIMKLTRFKDDYEEAVYRLAQRIITVAERAPVAQGRVTDYDSLDSAFGEEDRVISGDQRLRITVVAPQRDDLPEGRADSTPYGAAATDWNPYNSDLVRRPVAELGAALARGLGYRVDVGDLDQHEAELLAVTPHGPQVLIIDPWAMLLPRCQHLLSRLDTQDSPWLQVVIPWARDGEAPEAERKLRAALDATLPRKLAEVRKTSAAAVRGVATLDDFSMVLPKLILTAVKQYLRHAEAYPPDGPVPERPRLSGLAADPPIPLERSDD